MTIADSCIGGSYKCLLQGRMDSGLNLGPSRVQLVNNSTLGLITRANYYAKSLDLENFSLTTIFRIKTSYSQLKSSKNNSLINLQYFESFFFFFEIGISHSNHARF